MSITTDLEWDAISNASGYIINVGNQPDGTDIVNAEDVGNITSYTFASELPQNTEIFVTIHPYNIIGVNMVCSEYSFRTELLIPDCTVLTNPINGVANVSVSTNFSWSAVDYADGYQLNIGTSYGGTEIENNLDVGNTTNFTLPYDLPSETLFYATVIPYNVIGEAIGCADIVFKTEVIIPECPSILQPSNNQDDVSVSTNIIWQAIDDADGYIVSLGTSMGGNDIIDNRDVGDNLFYSLLKNILKIQHFI